MVFQEPKVEFVSIKLSDTIATSGTGGGQYCNASQEDAKYCPGWDGDVDWGAPST
jgi:hypothetical protein